MATYVAFLRGINVGGHTVRNDRLRELFTELELDAVRTFLSTGNVAFQTSARDRGALERRIESGLRGGLGYAVATFLRTAEEVTAVADRAAAPDWPETGKLHVGFLRAELAQSARDELAELAQPTDRVAFLGREVYWHVPGPYTDSVLSGPAVNKVLGDRWTLRTASTVGRIAAKLPG